VQAIREGDGCSEECEQSSSNISDASAGGYTLLSCALAKLILYDVYISLFPLYKLIITRLVLYLSEIALCLEQAITYFAYSLFFPSIIQ
jgi:hypothetical protein